MEVARGPLVLGAVADLCDLCAACVRVGKYWCDVSLYLFISPVWNVLRLWCAAVACDCVRME